MTLTGRRPSSHSTRPPASGSACGTPISLREPTPYGNLRMRMGSLSSASVALSHSSDDTTSGIAITASVRTGGPLG
jgi:hypothetical protein